MLGPHPRPTDIHEVLAVPQEVPVRMRRPTPLVMEAVIVVDEIQRRV